MKSKNRLTLKMTSAQKAAEKLFCAFLTLGFPSVKTTENLIIEFEKKGVDILELGFPFSDPMADGPTIQYSSEKALENGVSIQDAFRVVKQARRHQVRMPIVFFSYYNPVLCYGWEKFARDAVRAGFDGVIIPDLPPDEDVLFQKICRRYGLSVVYLMTPTTTSKRAKLVNRSSDGFIYYVSLRGVTGARKTLPGQVRKDFIPIRKMARKPVLIGFGVSSPDQAEAMSRISEGVIVGSAIVERLKKNPKDIKPVLDYVGTMVRAAKGRKK